MLRKCEAGMLLASNAEPLVPLVPESASSEQERLTLRHHTFLI